RLADRHARRVGLIAIGFFVIAGALGGSVASHLAPYGAEDPATESARASALLEDAGYRATEVVVLVRGGRVSDPAFAARVRRIERRLQERRDVAAVSGFYDTRSPDFVSDRGDATYLAVALRATDDGQVQDSSTAIADSLSGVPGVTVGGGGLAGEQVNEQVESDLRTAEMLAFPLLFLLSLVFFRSLVAALLPLMVGALAIVGTFLTLRIASEVGSISVFALNLTTGLGLGLAIDYSLFIVSRYREEIAKDGPGLAAMRRTLASAGRTVLFSSLTVAAAIASLIVFPQRFLYSMGIGGASVALIAAAVSLTVLPAVLTLLGTRVNSISPRFLRRRAEREAKVVADGFWYRLSRFVMRRPIPIATVTAAALIVLGIPFLGIKFNSVDSRVLPRSASARQVDAALRADFPPFRTSPIVIAVDGGGPGAAKDAADRIATVPGISTVNPPRRLGGEVTVIEAIGDSPRVSDRAQATAERLRRLPPPRGTELLVTGDGAEFLDLQASLKSHLPLALAIVVTVTFAILFLMTGSVILPIKSLLMNVLTLSAVFGLLVLIFQDGRLEGLLDYSSDGGIEQTMPILMFAVVFGLSTDYAVFLLSRIKEARDGGASDSECVAIGLERTGRIVTAAALLFAIAIGAFATSQIVFIKENGIGTALAVLIDATVIRALLVPSLMEMLGKWNWWAPAPLRRLHRRLGISEDPPNPDPNSASIGAATGGAR
ncbi:MAG: MMPL family transporter, partial [Solirubrobacterales bacterium]